MPPKLAIDKIIELRNKARAEKNWVLADNIRNNLANVNILMKDTKEGTTWEVQ